MTLRSPNCLPVRAETQTFQRPTPSLPVAGSVQAVLRPSERTHTPPKRTMVRLPLPKPWLPLLAPRDSVCLQPSPLGSSPPCSAVAEQQFPTVPAVAVPGSSIGSLDLPAQALRPQGVCGPGRRPKSLSRFESDGGVRFRKLRLFPTRSLVSRRPVFGNVRARNSGYKRKRGLNFATQRLVFAHRPASSNHISVILIPYTAPMTLTRLSPSRASDFKVCPQLYKFRSVDKLPEPVTVYQARGTTAHLALERLYDLPAVERTPERLYELFRASWTEIRATEEYQDLFENIDDERAWGVESMHLLANYFAVENPSEIEPLERELDMLEDLDGVVIRGILDRIDRGPDGSLIITDYKTGKAPPERYALGSFFALKIYALLIRQRLGETPSEIRLMYLNGPTMYRLEVDDKQLDAMDRQLRALWTAIEKASQTDHFPPRPGNLCNWCSFQDICPAMQQRVAS